MIWKREIQEAITLLRKASHGVALTGAGVSTPSGIPDFRGPETGLWENSDAMEAASIYGFSRHPEAFYEWVRPLAALIFSAQPNPAHIALAALERYGPLKAVLTQNVDLLHRRAGSRVVHEMHGHVRLATCIRCYQILGAEEPLRTFLETGEIPRCPTCGGVLKPNVILFGEQLPVSILNAARREARASDVMLIAGTSLEVAPACDLPQLAVETGAALVVINQSVTHIDHLAEVVIRANVEEILPELARPFLPAADGSELT